MLTAQMRDLIAHHSLGLVATVTPEGAPAVSPKGTFLIHDDRTIAFSNIRSPGTVRNIARNPAVEVNFIDVLHRTACRIRGAARLCTAAELPDGLHARFTEKWPQLAGMMKGFVLIEIADAKFLRSPVYDIGEEADALARHWSAYYKSLAEG
ncbi:hypothetical protein GCM10007874_06190 [Labrys miyagiensis]|uniref:Pyridoxamine 5'-phosphate oxidase N-terminal domain-containing protein n=1 Tax=Labrys miyagiensis TaxID=346912 RepID=A0ABQ6CBM7_9HYPH|nr:pyridoxamine 5'-phosphate oxidase family protein [Labrys miyagiensis]GLS17604.1 hypothetical protein GCM10007874_06190 [Labrys miyagiensis]